MKKIKKILALTCALALLCATAFPSSAISIDGSYDPENGDGFVSEYISAVRTIDGKNFTVSGTVCDLSNDDYIYSGYSVFHSGMSTTILEYGVEADTVVWQGSSNFATSYRTQLTTVAGLAGVAYEVGNVSDYIYAELDVSLDRMDYLVYHGCWHYAVNSMVTQNDSTLTTQNIARMPAIGGTYLFITN